MNLSKKSKEILIKSDILKWYKKNKRDLPWRKTYGKNRGWQLWQTWQTWNT